MKSALLLLTSLAAFSPAAQAWNLMVYEGSDLCGPETTNSAMLATRPDGVELGCTAIDSAGVQPDSIWWVPNIDCSIYDPCEDTPHQRATVYEDEACTVVVADLIPWCAATPPGALYVKVENV